MNVKFDFSQLEPIEFLPYAHSVMRRFVEMGGMEDLAEERYNALEKN